MIKNTVNKKSILICIGFLFLSKFCNSQIFNRIEYLLSENNLEAAKEAADSAYVMDKSAATCLLRSAVYRAIAKDRSSKGVASNASWEAFQSLQKSAAIDRSFVDSVLKTSQYRIVYDLFDQLKLEGILIFNAAAERGERQAYGNALSAFKKAAAAWQFIVQFDQGKPAVDTLLMMYLAKSSIYADKEIDAIFYSKKIIDSNFIYQPFKNRYEKLFQWLVFYYKGKRDEFGFFKYLHQAKQAFPAAIYFNLAEIDWLRDKGRYEELLEKYSILATITQMEPAVQFAYYRDLFHYAWDEKGNGREAPAKNRYKKELAAGLENFTRTAPRQISAAANLLLAKTYRNLAADNNDKSQVQQRRNFLQLSNKFLKLITSNPVTRNSPEGKEAVSLLRVNNIAWKSE